MAKFSPKKQRHIRRITRFIKSAEKRGYQFADSLKQNLTAYSTQKLKTLTPEKLYEQATSSRYGKEMTGTEARKIERSLSAKKGVETKKCSEQEYIPNFTDIVLSEVEAMIAYAIANPVFVGNRRTTEDNARDLNYELKSEIERYGRDIVALSCEQAPDSVKETAREAIYASSSTACRAHIEDMLQIIEGYIPTIEEAKQRDMSDLTDDNSDLELL